MRSATLLVVAFVGALLLTTGRDPGAAYAAASAQDAPKPAAERADRLAGLAFMSGSWRGTLFGQPAEEHWSAPQAETMVGMFRLGAAGPRPIFELLLVEPDGERIAMRLRHFGKAMEAMEQEPLVYRSTTLEKNRAVFENADDPHVARITYERTGQDSLVIELTFRSEGDAPQRSERAVFERFDPARK